MIMPFSPQLIKELGNVQEKNKERPLCYAYAVKARTLLLAHFQRLPLNPHTLQIGKGSTHFLFPVFMHVLNIC